MHRDLLVSWRLIPRQAPHILRHCRPCGAPQGFHSSGKFRCNLQKKSLDVWLVYRCSVCEATWNRPILERVTLRSLDAATLSAFTGNDPDLAWRQACSDRGLQRQGLAQPSAGDVRVVKRLLAPPPLRPECARVALTLQAPCALRLDRLLARELGRPRSCIRALFADGSVTAQPARRQAWRRPVEDGQRLRLALDAAFDNESLIAALTESRTCPGVSAT